MNSSAPAGAPAPAVPPDILALLVQGRAVGYTNVAFLMLLLYDHLLTFGMEVATVWTLPWRLPKIMFMINRYIVPPMVFFDGITPSLQLGEEICNFLVHWTSWPILLSLGAVDIILIIRVCAIYGNSKEIVWGLYSLYILTLVPWITLAIIVSLHTTAGPTTGTLFTDCIFLAPTYYWAAWIPPTFFESVLVLLTLYMVFQFDKISPTLRVLARDSVVYFFLIFAILLANAIIARFGQGFIGAALIVPCSVTACIAAARMMMNIRLIVPGMDLELTHISTKKIEFKRDEILVESSDTTRTVVQSPV